MSITKQLRNRYKAVAAFKLATVSAIQTPRDRREEPSGSCGRGQGRRRGRGELGGGRRCEPGLLGEETQLFERWRNPPRASREEGSQSPGGEGQ